MMNRREAIKQVTVLLGGVALTGSGLVTAVERAHARAAAPRAQVGTFTAQDIALLDEVADTILPETKTPGAKAAHVGAFMALIGFGILMRSLALVFGFVPLLILTINWLLRMVEEPELEKRLGDAYLQYKNRTPRFFPRIK